MIALGHCQSPLPSGARAMRVRHGGADGPRQFRRARPHHMRARPGAGRAAGRHRLITLCCTLGGGSSRRGLRLAERAFLACARGTRLWPVVRSVHPRSAKRRPAKPLSHTPPSRARSSRTPGLGAARPGSSGPGPAKRRIQRRGGGGGAAAAPAEDRGRRSCTLLRHPDPSCARSQPQQGATGRGAVRGGRGGQEWASRGDPGPQPEPCTQAADSDRPEPRRTRIDPS
jgi:hypothetical protein